MPNGANNIQAFVPEIWAKKMALVEKVLTNFKNDFANNEWEGEIKNFGDTVLITLPDPDNVIIGEGIVADASAVVPTQKTLVIDKSKNVAFKFNDIEQAQSQFNMIEGYLSIGLQKISDAISLEMQQAVFDDTRVEEMGTSSAGIAVTVDNVYDFVVDIKVKLTDKGVLDTNGWYLFKGNQEEAKLLRPMLVVTPKVYGTFLKSTQLTHPTVAGDDILKSGERKQIAGFEIIPDTNIKNVTGTTDTAQPFIAGTKMGITYASQFEKVEALRDLDSFADIVRALQLYGFAIVHPKSLVKGWVNPSATVVGS